MRCKLANTAQGNRDYQRELAAALIASDGLDAALQTCLNNGWEGVMHVLLATRIAAPTQARDQAVRPHSFAPQARLSSSPY